MVVVLPCRHETVTINFPRLSFLAQVAEKPHGPVCESGNVGHGFVGGSNCLQAIALANGGVGCFASRFFGRLARGAATSHRFPIFLETFPTR